MHQHQNDVQEHSHSCCSDHSEENRLKKQLANNRFLGVCCLIAAGIISVSLLWSDGSEKISGPITGQALASLEKEVLPQKGVTLPAIWGDLGKQLVENGTIDKKKFEDLYAGRGGLDEEAIGLLAGTDNGRLVINEYNANTVLNLLWALGLGNKNEILEKGPMMDKKYGGADRFASTGGWTLAVGAPINHYSRHSMIALTPEQQILVQEVAKNIFRPCCGNPTHFPDCNHGMAMLGLLELMASQGVSEKEMYKAALAVNSYWFPDTYLTIAQYLKSKDMKWKEVSPKEILGPQYSSGYGFQQIKNQVEGVNKGGGNSCGV